MKAQAMEELSRLKESYVKGLNLCQKGDWEAAEKELVQVLKPVLSKSSMKSIYINLEDVKDKALDAMYHLGLVYLNSPKYFEHYAKAAAIFQYCAAFAKKHEVGEVEHFLKEAHAVEEIFLKAIGVDTIGYISSRKQVEDYRRELENLRIEVKQQLAEISNLTIENIGKRAEVVEKIYQNSNSFFVNHDMTAQKLGLIQRLLTDCHKQLGGVPQGCEHTVIGLGSLSHCTMTPWSDLEFAILVNDGQYKDYFRNLSKLLHIKVINLGETHLKSVGVESLNNFRSIDPKDEWFWDDVMKIKFNFDSTRHNACKVALGRQGGYQVSQKIEDENGIEQTVIITKPDYELILTPKEMAEFQKEEFGWFETDKHLVQALLSTSLIDGSQYLLDQYRQEIKQAAGPQLLKDRALKILAEDIDRFSLKLKEDEEGKLIDTKQDIYRLGDRVVSGLADYYDITAVENQPILSVWQMIERMGEKRIINQAGAKHLKEAVAIATELRLRTYAHNDTREESIQTYIPAVDHLTEEQKHKFLHATFHFQDTSMLHHFYYVMLRVQNLVRGFCNQTYHKVAELVLKLDNLFDESNYNKSMIHARFLEYDESLKCMEAAKERNPQDLSILLELLSLYSKTRAIDKSLDIGQIILELMKNKYKDEPNHPDIAGSYNNLGAAYSAKGNYDEAIRYYTEALAIMQKAYDGSLNRLIAGNYNNLGAAYSAKGSYEEAIEYLNIALTIRQKFYKNSPHHPDIASSYSNLGAAYSAKGSYDEAIKYHNKALAIKQKAYESIPNHLGIATSYNNLGATYSAKGSYDEAIECYNKSLAIKQKIYESIPNHPDIAGSYNNLGVAYRYKGNYDEAIEYHNKALVIMQKAYNGSFNHLNISSIQNLQLTIIFQKLEPKVLAAFGSVKKMRDENNDAIIKIATHGITKEEIQQYCKAKFCNKFSEFEINNNECYITLDKNCRDILRKQLSLSNDNKIYHPEIAKGTQEILFLSQILTEEQKEQTSLDHTMIGEIFEEQ